MRLRQIEYFIAVAEAGSLTKASRAIFIAQPSLSQQITNLEEELGAQLFERLPRGLQLTSEGRAFLVEARRVVAAVSRAKATVRAATSGVTGELRLATVTSLAVRLVPDAAGAWSRTHPNVTLYLGEYNHSDALEEALDSGASDLSIGPMPRREHGAVVSLGMEEFCFVLPHDDPLSARERIDPADLADRSWVLFGVEHGLTQIIERVCANSGFSPNVAVRTSQVTTAARLAAAGLGPTLIPVNSIDTAGVEVRSASRPILRELAAYSRTGLSALDRTFLEALAASPAAPKPLADYDVRDGYFQL